MKTVAYLISVFFLLTSCVTKNLKGYEDGLLISERNNLEIQDLPSTVDISVNKLSVDNIPVLKVSVYKNDLKRNEWEDFYQKVAVYDAEKYNILLNRREHYELKEVAPEKVVKRSEEVLKSEKKFPPNLTAILEINGNKTEAVFNNNYAYFPIKKLKNDFRTPFEIKFASVKIGEESFSLTNELIDFMDKEYKSLHPEKFYKGADFLKYKYKLEFCNSPNVSYLIVSGRPKYEKKCMYIIDRRFRVIQSTNAGALLQPMGLPNGMPQQTIFLKSTPRFADDEQVQNLLAEYIGLNSYVTVMGAEKTVHAFKYLGDVSMTYQNSGAGGWLIDQDQQ